MEKRYDIVDAFIYGMKNMMRTLRELTETKEEIRIVKKGNRCKCKMFERRYIQVRIWLKTGV